MSLSVVVSIVDFIIRRGRSKCHLRSIWSRESKNWFEHFLDFLLSNQFISLSALGRVVQQCKRSYESQTIISLLTKLTQNPRQNKWIRHFFVVSVFYVPTAQRKEVIAKKKKEKKKERSMHRMCINIRDN